MSKWKKPATTLKGNEKSDFFLLTINGEKNIGSVVGFLESHSRRLESAIADENHLVAGWWGQEEEAPTSGHVHLQTVVRFKKRLTYNQADEALLSLFGKTPASSLRSPLGDYKPVWTTPHKCIAYCTKLEKRAQNGHYWSYGAEVTDDTPVDIDKRSSLNEAAEKPGKGSRSDLKAAKDYIAHNPTMRFKDLSDKFEGLFLSNEKFLRRLYCMYHPGKVDLTEGIFVDGETGTGKSSSLAAAYPKAYWLGLGGSKETWWDNYDGEPIVIIDEYYPGAMDEMVLKRLLDRTPYLVPVKNAFTPFLSAKVIILSNFTFDECFPPNTHSMDAVRRRFSHHINYVLDTDGATQVSNRPLPLIGTVPPTNLTDLQNDFADALAETPKRYAKPTLIPYLKRRKLDTVEVEKSMLNADNYVEA